uniref:Dihydrolipoyllysine-residue succinyltransferase component of 2-oxoglutarate dehydrogenase complex, mitochondrial n=1 Tax=Meloidogyne floridensis TaxID=298350 RepID=A0A915NU42_9BILA
GAAAESPKEKSEAKKEPEEKQAEQKPSDAPKKPPPVPELPKEPMESKHVSEIKPKVVPPILQQQAFQPKGDSTGIIGGSRSETRVKMNRMRQRIAERLKEAQNTNAMLTTFNEIDLFNVMQMRKKYQESFTKKHGVKLGLMSPFVRASAIALQEQPVVNAVIDGEEILYRNYADISIAVATPKGLVVPVLRNVESLSYSDIEKSLGELGIKARENKLAIEDMEGGTFTISNGGVFGSMFGTPIINPPQSAILGMHGIFDRPVAIDGKVEIRPMMYVALTYDHRLIDGREAVTFLRKIKQYVEDPLTILLNL